MSNPVLGGQMSLFTKAKWLKVTECSMPAFDGGLDLSIHIRRKRERLLSVVQVDAIANAVSNARAIYY